MPEKWENWHRQEDEKRIKKANKCNTLSTIYIVIGALCIYLSWGIIWQMIESSAYSNTGLATSLCVFAVGFVFLLRAMHRWEIEQKLIARHYEWIPTEDEIGEINERFDNNELVQALMKFISCSYTRSVTVNLDSITISNRKETATVMLGRYGYNPLSNYSTKQLAYYIGSHVFTEGFVIYQLRVTTETASGIAGGTTDVGGEEPVPEKKIRHIEKLLSWLISRIVEIFRIKVTATPPKEKQGNISADNGQILLNKAFTTSKNNYKQM